MSIPLSHTIFEIGAFVMLAACIVFRLKKKDIPPSSVFLEIFAILVFCTALEVFAVALNGYSYNPAHINILGVPLYICLGWTSIVFVTMWLTDLLKMPEWARPFLGAFLALLLDLTLDTVAVRDGMWNWGINLDEEWFGVPWFNFAGWWLIVFALSSMMRFARLIYRKSKTNLVKYIYPTLGCILGLEFFLIIGSGLQLNNHLFGFISLMSISLIVTTGTWRGFREKITIKKDFPLFFIPSLFFSLFIGLLVIKGYYSGALPILLMSISMLIINAAFLVIITTLSNKRKNY